jgi:hypothetical protein
MSAHRYVGGVKFGGRMKTELMFKTREEQLRDRVAKALEAGAQARRRMAKEQTQPTTIVGKAICTS